MSVKIPRPFPPPSISRALTHLLSPPTLNHGRQISRNQGEYAESSFDRPQRRPMSLHECHRTDGRFESPYQAQQQGGNGYDLFRFPAKETRELTSIACIQITVPHRGPTTRTPSSMIGTTRWARSRALPTSQPDCQVVARSLRLSSMTRYLLVSPSSPPSLVSMGYRRRPVSHHERIS